MLILCVIPIIQAMLVVDEAKLQGPFGRFQRAVSILTTFAYQFQYYFTIAMSIYSLITGWWTFLAVMGTIIIVTIPLKRNEFFIKVVSKYLLPCKHFDKFEIIYQEIIPNEEPNIFGVHPHSIYSIGMLGSMNSSFNSPLSRMVGLGSRFLMNFPIAGALLKLWGLQTVEPANVKRLMRARKNIGLIPGGFEEATITSPHEMRIWVENRKGFIKYSLEHGYTIRPVITLNEHQAFSTFEPWMKFRLALNRLKFPAVLYINKLTLFFLPPWTKIHVIVGRGIREEVREGEKVTQEMIDRAHRGYVEEIMRIYDKYRNLNGDKPIKIF